jgi:hypothetical protein
VEEEPYGRDEREEPVRVKLVAGQESRFEVDGETMASGFGLVVCILDKRVLEESRQRMSWQEIGREDTRECEHEPECAVDL